MPLRAVDFSRCPPRLAGHVQDVRFVARARDRIYLAPGKAWVGCGNKLSRAVAGLADSRTADIASAAMVKDTSRKPLAKRVDCVIDLPRISVFLSLDVQNGAMEEPAIPATSQSPCRQRAETTPLLAWSHGQAPRLSPRLFPSMRTSSNGPSANARACAAKLTTQQDARQEGNWPRESRTTAATPSYSR